ncbi:MAG TPA: epoxyqueuosine reductase [Firmicutes bacterium]|nr:epoxyqueuosine reductase [Bacillota bacterium]
MELFDKIRQLAENHAIDYIGVAGIAKYQQEIAVIGGTVAGKFPRAISIGIVLPQSIVDLLQERDCYENVFQYQTHAYDVINQRLDNFASIVGSQIQKSGYRVMPLPAAERIDSERVCASLSHKLTARLAGFGWIGKNCLLINPDHGPRVRWTSVLTDAPFAENEQMLENRCGNCTECVKACPARAIKGCNYADGESGEERLSVAKCEAYFESLGQKGRLKICGMCLYACPYGKKFKAG